MNDREKNGLRGQVASVRSEFFSCDPRTGEVSSRLNATIKTYDRDGRITSVVAENPNGSVSTSTYTYSGDGPLTEIKSELDGILTWNAISQYDSDGKLVRTDQTQSGIKWQASSCTYDDAGNKTEVQFPLPGLVLAEMMNFARKVQQESGAPAREVGSDISLTATTTTRYDAAGNPLEQLRHNENQELIGRTTYTYDDQARPVEKREEIGRYFSLDSVFNDPAIEPLQREVLQKAVERLFDPAGGSFRTSYTYDSQGRKIEEVIHQGPFGFSRQTFEYDEYGNVTSTHNLSENREFEAAPDGRFSAPSPARQQRSANHFHYTHDSHGNWTQKQLTTTPDDNGQPQHAGVERRIITYHSSEV